VSLSALREAVVNAAKEKGRNESEGEVESKLWEGLKVGGKKQRVKVEFE
jgi:CRISPR/Cas system-associated protein Cas5 (RAMP superfamily)